MMRKYLALAACLLGALWALAPPAKAGGNCIFDPFGGIECTASGGSAGSGSSSTGSAAGSGTTTRPPLRYLAVRSAAGVGPCWSWSRTPPGIDAWDPANDGTIIRTRLRLPECPRTSAPPASAVDVPGRAWEVFRSFELPAPQIAFEPPDAGITGLPTYVSATSAPPVEHREVLPGGIALEVRAEVAQATVDWGDGTVTTHLAAALAPYPAGTATHVYETRTCSAEYRAEHPTAASCHPTFDAYPVSVTYTWSGRYRYDAGWIDLGTLERTTSIGYDVDEVVGLLEP